jgi:hypothetical protein
VVDPVASEIQRPPSASSISSTTETNVGLMATRLEWNTQVQLAPRERKAKILLPPKIPLCVDICGGLSYFDGEYNI